MKKLLAFGAMLLSCIDSSVSAMKCEDNTARVEFCDGSSMTMEMPQSIKDQIEKCKKLSPLCDKEYNELIGGLGENSVAITSVCEMFLFLQDNDADSVSKDDVKTLREGNVDPLIEMNEKYKQCYSNLSSKFSSNSQVISVLRSNNELLSAMLKCAHDKFSSLEVALGIK